MEEVERLNNEIDASEKKLEDLAMVWTVKSRTETMHAPLEERATWNPAGELEYLWKNYPSIMSELEVSEPDDPTAEVVREGAGTSNDQTPKKA